jgi:hypothetical protein
MTTAAALRGYLLEEVLAKLLADSGYSLLTCEDQDQDALKAGRHGLLVRGRGANHQADALGDLKVPIPFSLPVRLFVEAKFKDPKVGLRDVRNALAVVTDVNERHNTDGARRLRLPFRRYHYRYSLFSMSGFSGPAEEFALAHQISLIDLQGPAFDGLRNIVSRTAEGLLELQARENIPTLPTGQIRTALRLALETIRPAPGRARVDVPDAGIQALRRATEQPVLLPEAPLQRLADSLAQQIGESGLILGFLKAPFLLALQPDDVEQFQQWLRGAAAVVNMNIRFAPGGPVDGDWVVIPQGAPRGAMLRFGVPARLLEWLVSGDADPSNQAAEVKREFFSSMTIFDREGRSVELRLNRRQSESLTGPPMPGRTRYDALREELADPHLPEAPRRPVGRRDVPHGFWTAHAARELLHRLRGEGRVAQVQVLRAAAHTGSITRRQFFEVTGYPPERGLRGIRRPILRITADLVAAGILPPGVEPALARPQSQQDLAFVMPPDLAAILRRGQPA